MYGSPRFADELNFKRLINIYLVFRFDGDFRRAVRPVRHADAPGAAADGAVLRELAFLLDVDGAGLAANGADDFHAIRP